MSQRPQIFVTRRLPQPALDMLAQHAEITVWPEPLPPPRPELLRAVAAADALVSLVSDRIDAELFDAAPRLRVVSNYAAGYDNIDLPEATKRGVLVTNTPGTNTETTADLAFALLLAAARRIVEAARYVSAGRWQAWQPDLLLGRDLYGATLGIVGMGQIGQAMARRGRGFGMKLVYASTSPRPEAERELGATRVELPELLASSDFISLHCPLTPATRGLINRAALAHMRDGAVLVNTARGPVVDTDALVEALRSRPLAAGLDVTDPYPLPADHPLLALPNAVVVPHIGSATYATRTRMGLLAAQNALAALRGERPPHLLNPEVLQN